MDDLRRFLARSPVVTEREKKRKMERALKKGKTSVQFGDAGPMGITGKGTTASIIKCKR